MPVLNKERSLVWSSYLGILAQVSDAQAIAFSFPHQATALENNDETCHKNQLK